ncbi:aminotransferase class I/II-fold pyridoxal phosphate-dependent enzyme, partial [Acidobacteria bacterium ACD]|nr:aminotransferase class I/II-fold pyridoxal phosphate-dependent enzyme [Acidobacteria bacterium ACD]
MKDSRGSSARALAFAALALASAFPALAEDPAAVSGTVRALDGSALPGTRVTLVEPTRRLTVRVTSGDHGVFRASSLPPGTWTLTAELAGFLPRTLDPLFLSAGERLTVEVRLEVATVREALTVLGSAPRDTLEASEIREILKITQRPGVISFAGGLPAPELFPVKELQEASRLVLEEQGTTALQYSTTEGHPPLRTKIAERMNRKWGTRLTASEILVTVGSQQGLDLVAKLFLDEGDVVVCESPTYLGAISAFNVFRPRWVEVPTDGDGMDMEALERVLRTTDRVKLVYVVPNFQNPTGRTWSLERRKRLAELATRFDVPVLEDNPYGEMRFEGEDLPAIQALEPDSLVLSVGTFSKIFFPGMRIGWVAAPRRFLDRLVILKQGTDLHTPTFTQLQLNRY